ncbi:MAG: hypothetical protein COW00_09815 [Bdellovibrio sp. CG12_big_fil_rev_8_21_14_0_65_39_13]|nr:MAG: hypothetical protein COW78_15880 [Bdellovibrio sp. CG22_combo_CG10-13_8_21_14_all_39_27]PIQ59596.1 MAG: hypothetical protein COW00_09815 [Bdellovibrio sp. CG12_big_fil_rev_8_21_14_0_65_39_13]PIR33168.1 MAG: hypothetical protein COV37_17130 [Bdellovibrio sp. CG11_big_fil_rev_8_21_14_0_20_39_38]
MRSLALFLIMIISSSVMAADSGSSSTENFPMPTLGSRVQRVAVGLGQNSLGGDYGDLGDNGLGVDVYYGYRASYMYELMVNAHHFSMDNEQKTQTINMTSLNASVKGNLYSFDSLDFFAQGGLGLYWPQAERNINGQKIDGDAKAVMGWTAGVGADLKLNSQYSTGVLGQYHDPFDQRTEDGQKLGGRYFKLMWTFSYYL